MYLNKQLRDSSKISTRGKYGINILISIYRKITFLGGGDVGQDQEHEM